MNDLGKAEDDVLELIGNALDRVSMSSRLCIFYCIVYNPLHTNSTSYYMHTNLQNSDVGRSVHDYISKKKADRAAEKKNQMGNGNNKVAKAEANVVSIHKQQVEKDTVSRAPLPIAIPADELKAADTSAPVTSKFDPSISCSFENIFSPSLKKLFASAGSENVDVICGKPQVQSQSASRIEAKQRIAKLLVDGWKVSSEGCPNCNLPLFISSSQHVHTINGLKRCVMCGPVADKSFTQKITAKISKEELTMKMVKRVMQVGRFVVTVNVLRVKCL